MIYLDHNATTPVLPEVFEAMLPFFREEWGNPSSSYRFGSRLKKVIEMAREHVVAAMKPGSAARQCIRFSLGVTNTAKEVRETFSAIRGILSSLTEAR
jgi:cysteine desulfurase